MTAYEEMLKQIDNYLRDAYHEADGPPACLWPDGSLRRSSPNCSIDREEFKEIGKALRELKEQVKELKANAGFFKCCLLSGEMPKEGAEPFPNASQRSAQ